jgi:hypothetical protein
MFIGGGFIQGAEMGDTYGVRRNDAPEWVKDGPNPRCIHFSQGYLVHHRLIFDIEKLGGLIVPEDSERLWLSPGFNIYNLNTATYTKFSQQPWNESAHRHYFNDLDHAEWECDF